MLNLSTNQLILGTNTITSSGNTLYVNSIVVPLPSVSIVSGNFSISTPPNTIYLVNTLQTGVSGLAYGITGTFPNSSGLSGYQLTIKDWKGSGSFNNIILTGTNNQTFDGNINFIMNINYSSYNFLSDGNNWVIV